MQATSSEQFDASISGAVPGIEEVRDGIFAVGMSSIPHGGPTYTLSYVVLDSTGAPHLIDPATDSVVNWDTLVRVLARFSLSPADVATITVTHLHPDHLGMAERVHSASGAPIVMHRREQLAVEEILGGTADSPQALAAQLDGWGMPEDARSGVRSLGQVGAELPERGADVLLDDGDRLDIPGRELLAIHTPGHTPGHLCIRDVDESVLFSGDHVLPTLFSGIGLGGPTSTNPLADYLGALRRVAAFDDHEVLPGHGYRFRGLAGRCQTIEAHHRRRSAEVAAALEARPDASVWQIAGELTWSLGWENLTGLYRQSALTQTAMHVEFVRTQAQLPQI